MTNFDRKPTWMWQENLIDNQTQVDFQQDSIRAGVFKQHADKATMYAQGAQAFLEGCLPEKPIIDKDTRVLAFGSCFAAHFAEWLAANGFNRGFDPGSDESLIRNVVETPAAVVQQFRWAFGEMDPALAIWIGPDVRRFEPTEARRVALRDRLASADVIVITLGWAEIWYDTVSGEPLWRMPPRKMRNTGRYSWRFLSTAETTSGFETLDRIRREHLPDTRFVYTISPQRAAGTFSNLSPIVAHVTSKAVLKAALHEFLLNHAEDFNRSYFYFPSYEIATQLLHDPLQADNMHIRDHLAAFIMELFARNYTTAALEADPTVPASPDDELYKTIEVLDKQVASLDIDRHEKQSVIERLERERATLQAAADERKTLIEQLDAELQRLRTTAGV